MKEIVECPNCKIKYNATTSPKCPMCQRTREDLEDLKRENNLVRDDVMQGSNRIRLQSELVQHRAKHSHSKFLY